MSNPKELDGPKVETPAGRERRVRVRYPAARESMCQPGEGRLDQVWWLARITDMSTTGIALVLGQVRQRFPAGTMLTVELQNWSGDTSRTLPTRVIHMTPHPDGGWIMGCAFVNPLSEEELKTFL
jgi:hypothetical protein